MAVDNTREKIKTEMAERLRQFNEHIDAAIDQWVHHITRNKRIDPVAVKRYFTRI